MEISGKRRPGRPPYKKIDENNNDIVEKKKAGRPLKKKNLGEEEKTVFSEVRFGLNPDYIKMLEEHFGLMGLSLEYGLRIVCYQYLKQNNLVK